MEILIALSGLILAYLLFRYQLIGIILAILFATLGELSRLPESTGLNYLLNDIFLPFFIIIWIIKKISSDRKFTLPPLLLPIIVWIIIAGVSLTINSAWLNENELTESLLYLGRFIEYFFLYIIAYDTIQNSKKSFSSIFTAIVGGTLVISILGFLQLKYFPSFFELGMQDLGWDPHIGRLLSTWFDPNFAGGFLAFIICILFGILISYKWKKHLLFIIFTLTSAIILSALYLTYSRSAYLACLLGLLVIIGIKSRKLLIGGLIIGVVALTILIKTQPRFMDLWESFQGMTGLSEYASYFNPDATARLRLESWENAMTVIKENFWLGSGYNSYKYAQWNLGLIQDLESHEATGSDSSLLTIFATTGLLGIIAYLWFYIKAIILSIKSSCEGEPTLQKSFNLGLAGGLMALIIHSTFVNSLLFPHILVFFWISLALIKPTHN